MPFARRIVHRERRTAALPGYSPLSSSAADDNRGEDHGRAVVPDSPSTSSPWLGADAFDGAAASSRTLRGGEGLTTGECIALQSTNHVSIVQASS